MYREVDKCTIEQVPCELCALCWLSLLNSFNNNNNNNNNNHNNHNHNHNHNHNIVFIHSIQYIPNVT